MSDVLHITEAVVTGDQLRRLHQGQEEIRFSPGTVVTPTGWDYVREQRLRVSRGEAPAKEMQSRAEPVRPQTGIPEVAPTLVAGNELPAGEGLIQEVPPQMVAAGRCDQPNQPYGCKSDEFGSGYVEPSSCADCPVHDLQKEGKESSGCEGCNRSETARAAGQDDIEGLVQQITDLVMDELGQG